MHRNAIRVCLASLCLATLLMPAWGQKRMALVIGNSNYVHESRLSNPVNDAGLIARTLQAQGFQVQERRNLGKTEMDLALIRFIRESAGADSAVIYYAGHGAQPLNGGRNFLLPVDAQVDSDDTLEAYGIAADRIVEQMERQANPARLRLVVLDACRNNRLAGKARSNVRGLARMTPGDDYTLIAFSTNDQDVALDGTGAHSPYAAALARHLTQADRVPLRAIFERTAAEVRAATGQKQKPRTYGDLHSAVLLNGNQSAAGAYEAGAAAHVEQQAWAAAQRANTAAGYAAYLAEYPAGQFAAAARVAQAGLQGGNVVNERQPRPGSSVAPTAGTVVKDCDDCPELVVVSGGSFQRGSVDGPADEQPARAVTIASFLAGRTEVTQGQWRALMGSNPSGFSRCGDKCPVENVSWHEAQSFVNRLSQRTLKPYRLLTEAEWEYVARASSTSRWSFGDDESQLSEHAWYEANSGKRTQPVAGRRPNAFGLFDLHGNVWEWVQDCYTPSGYAMALPTDGRAYEPAYCSSRSLRGGSWYFDAGRARSASRGGYAPDTRSDVIGFRVARALP